MYHTTTVLNLKPPSVKTPLSKLRRRRKISKPLSKIWKFQTQNLKTLTRDLEIFEKSQNIGFKILQFSEKLETLNANFRAAGENFGIF